MMRQMIKLNQPSKTNNMVRHRLLVELLSLKFLTFLYQKFSIVKNKYKNKICLVYIIDKKNYCYNCF